MRLSNFKALTLTELLVAVALMGIVMLAVASLDVAMRQAYQTSSKGADVSMRVAAAMLHITNNTAVATGMRNDAGIIIPPPIPPDHYLFIRHDGGDPSTYTDDTWVRYHYNDTNKDLLFCSSPSLTTPDPSFICASEYLILNAETFAVNFIHDDVQRKLYLDVTISSLSDNTKAYDPPLNNPRSQLQSYILPLQHTW